MKSLLTRMALLISAGYLFLLVWQACVGHSFVTDHSMRGPDFWYDQRHVVATMDRPVIPIQLPGPMDGWAGPGPKEIVITVPGNNEAVIDFYFLDSHESFPPRLEILVNGQVVANAQVAKGAGVGLRKWSREGKPSRLSVNIPAKVRNEGNDTIVIRVTEGSWVAIDKITVKEEAPLWKLVVAFFVFILLTGSIIRDYRKKGASGPIVKGASVKYAIFAAITIVFSSFISLVAGEMVLRIIYRDGGASTSEGPGGKAFSHTFVKSGGRFVGNGASKKSAARKILIQGDSITYGLGVRDWEAIFPNILYEKLANEGKKYEMRVKSVPNRELDFHRAKLYEMVDSINPDIIIYQWYHNDIELEYCHNNTCGRPEFKIAFWRRLAFHKWLRGHSYLYFFLDIRVAQSLSDYNRSYIEYLTDDFAEGTIKGQRFRTEFYRWATVASAYADQVIVMLYPALPISGENPFHVQHDWMKKLSKPHTFHIAAYTTSKNTGVDYFTEGDGINHIARKAREGIDKPGLLVDGPEIPITRGRYEVSFRLRTKAKGVKTIATIEAIRKSTGEVLARRRLTEKDFDIINKWRKFTLAFEVKNRLIKDLSFRVWYEGGADISVDQISLPVKRELELIDLIPLLNGFDTHASRFDWHPNAKAHEAMAKTLYEAITGKEQDESN